MSTALYRRYRPDRFEDVIGQDHVTVPLRTALAKDRVNHAYLFSGPRGCGKTTSARILARCLNCAQGPTPTPCGECDSCRDLATGGPGSLDVLEIDAASHGGVEDARGLRERATFAPVRDRYKILIIDEAHMVTAAGFNALLKIVEEPPEHLKFIFATTEPEKVIGTIRSRTHHYPFRLVPPEPLIAYLEQLCAEEGVSVEKGVLPLVVRAGTGSVRDTLSVLDQLIAGAQEGQVSYELAVSLLGFTPEALLDDVIDAVAADDTPTVFRVVDRVVQSGQDPRRFVEDLLDRFRDLVIARALPEEAGAILHGMPEDQVRRLSAQAAQLSRAELSRLADVTNLALTDMVGATSPRLHLELLMARLLLPASDETHRGLAARLEALERRLELGGAAPVEDGAPEGTTTPARSGTPAADGGGSAENADGSGPLTGAALARAAMRRPEESAPRASTAPPERWAPPAPQSVAEAPEGDAAAGATGSERPQQPPQPRRPEPAEVGARPEDARRPEAGSRPEPEGRPEGRPQAQERTGAAPAPAHGPEATAAPSSPTPAPAASQVEMIRRAWPDILAALEDASRLVWMLVKDNASVAGYDGSLLTIGFQQDGPRQSLLGRGGDRVLGEAVHQVLGIRPRLDLILGGDAPTGDARTQSGARPAGPARTDRPERPAPPQGRPDRPAAQPNRPAPAPGQAPREPESSRPAPPRSAAPSTAEDDPAPPAAPPRATQQRQTPQPSPAWTPAAPATSWGPAPTSTTPAPAPPADGWGGPDEEPPAWDDAPPPEEDPWDSLPAFDPDAEQDDSAGPEGWTPPARDAEERPVGAAGWDGPVPSVEDWGAPPQAAPAPGGAAPDAGQDSPVRPDAPAPDESEPSAEEVRRAYDPGPLVREEEHSIPVFARPEAELRAEFAKRFGATRPAGFDDGAGAAADGDSARPATPSPAPDDDAAATERRDPHPAASDAGPSSDEQRRPTGAPTADATPDPGVPADDADATPRAAAGPTGADLPGSGHPASMYPRLMERLRAGGPLEPPVNAGSSGGSGTGGGPGAPGGPGPNATPGSPAGGRPSAASLGARPADAEPARGASAPPSLDARAAAIRAAREAAQGRGPARPADTGPATPATSGVGWEDEVASDDDVPLEDSGLVGRAVVERVLGGRLLEERPNDA